MAEIAAIGRSNTPKQRNDPKPAGAEIRREYCMTTFQWNSNFVTNLPTVDGQHRHLVDLVNTLGDHLGRDEINELKLDALFQALVDYAGYHFSEEEALMRQVGIDSRHIEGHAENHRNFIYEIELLKTSGGTEIRDIASRMLDYLIHWLSYHILGQDQNMARQIVAVRSGVDPADAFDAEEREQDAAIQPLLDALNGLLAQLSSRNRELLQLNRSLEQRVIERTHALSEANERLQTISLEDSLTGLSNRRHAMMQLKTFWAEGRERGNSLAALMIDADNFKAVNDRYGHDAGDSVLVELARALKDSVRTDDLVFRLGGDEFLVLCPSTDLEGALTVAEQLERKIVELRVPVGDATWTGSISIGVASQKPRSLSFDELIKEADDAVYRAKAAGRNCIRCAGLSADDAA